MADKQPLLSSPSSSYSSVGSNSDSIASKMGVPSESISSDSGHHPEPEKNIKCDVVVTESKLFKRSNHDGTFETDSDSLETFYEPIKEYEGRHRYDPSFAWDAKEEKKIVRKVCSELACS